MRNLIRLIAALSICICGIAHAYDATEDFFSHIDPNNPPMPPSVWHYGYSIGTGYFFRSFNVEPTSTHGWISEEYNSLGAPSVWKSTALDTINGVAPGQLAMHSGPDPYSPAVVRFVAPEDGSYSYFVQFFAGDVGETRGSVFVNNSINDPLADFLATSGNPSTAGSILMNTGDTFDVAVGNLADRFGFLFGSTPVDILIVLDPVPEPPIALLFVLGLASLALARKSWLPSRRQVTSSSLA